MRQKLSLIILLFTFAAGLRAQTPVYDELVRAILNKKPSMNLQGKLIAFVSCDTDTGLYAGGCAEFTRMQSLYGGAMLRGGKTGLVVVLLTAAEPAAESASVGPIALTAAQCPRTKNSGKINAVYDQEGQLVYSNLTTKLVFASFRNLITRQ